MRQIRETTKYEMVKALHMGTTAIIRKSDNKITDWNTGVDAENEIEDTIGLTEIEFNDYCKTLKYS